MTGRHSPNPAGAGTGDPSYRGVPPKGVEQPVSSARARQLTPQATRRGTCLRRARATTLRVTARCASGWRGPPMGAELHPLSLLRSDDPRRSSLRIVARDIGALQVLLSA